MAADLRPSRRCHTRDLPILLAQASTELCDRYESLKAFLTALGDDVQLKQLKYYVAFRRLKNFACVEVHPQSGQILVYVKVDPVLSPSNPGSQRT